MGAEPSKDLAFSFYFSSLVLFSVEFHSSEEMLLDGVLLSSSFEILRNQFSLSSAKFLASLLLKLRVAMAGPSSLSFADRAKG